MTINIKSTLSHESTNLQPKALKILFLCTGNSCRSQMAEGWAKYYFPNQENYLFFSAGTTKHGMNQRAIQVMQEVGVDISSHYSKTVEDLRASYTDPRASELLFDLVITVCSEAHENCPYIPAQHILHMGFEDPPRLTKNLSQEEEILEVYRRIRDEIKLAVKNFDFYSLEFK